MRHAIIALFIVSWKPEELVIIHHAANVGSQVHAGQKGRLRPL